MLPPIFIIGCARSGTSILGEFFENNSQCQYYFDEDIWDPNFNNLIKKTRTSLIRGTKFSANKPMRKLIQKVSNSFSSNNEDKNQSLTEDDVTNEVIIQTEKAISALSKDRFVIHGPKHSIQIKFIKKLFPDAKFLHIIRDGRDVTCSLKRGMEDNLWVHHKPPGWKKFQNKPTLKKCAWLWNETINIINKDSNQIPSEDFLEIKYEDLVNEPEKTMRHVFEKFGIPYEKHQKELSKKVQDNLENSYHSKVSAKWTVKNHKKRIGRYKENLNEQELKQVESILGTNNKKFGY